MGRKTLRQRRDRDLKREQLETFGLDETLNPNNRVGQLQEKIAGLNDPQDIMLEIHLIFWRLFIIENIVPKLLKPQDQIHIPEPLMPKQQWQLLV